MFPLNDTEPNRYNLFPILTLVLILANTAIYIVTPEYTWDFLMRFGSTPYLLLHRQGGGVLSSVTSMFLHGSWFHLIGNMWALWVFGRRVEDAFGPWRYLIYYLTAGILADVITAAALGPNPIPGIGASGAIFGVMGAYLVLFPEGRIRTLVILQFIPTWPRIRAGWVVLYFFAVQVIPAIDTMINGTFYGIGHWAHIGGFMACVFAPLFLRPDAFARYLSNVRV